MNKLPKDLCAYFYTLPEFSEQKRKFSMPH